MICKELNKEFKTDAELFKALRENKEHIIAQKKAQVYKSLDKGTSIKARPIKLNEQIKGVELDDNHYYIVVNSTNILDSHKDLHVKGIWKKTAKEQDRKNYLVDTHVISLNTTIARKENVEILIATVPFSSIGKDYQGDTEVLIYKIAKDKIVSPLAKEWLDSGDDIEASVRMQYVKIELAMNSLAKEDKKEKQNFESYSKEIANKDDFEEIKYFWIVKEAKNKQESSLVLFGSNATTGQFKEPSADTHKEVAKALQTSKKQFFKQLLN